VSPLFAKSLARAKTYQVDGVLRYNDCNESASATSISAASIPDRSPSSKARELQMPR